MIHPDTELRFVNPKIGYGIFATKFIPKGTITYVKDLLEIEVSEQQFLNLDSMYKKIIDKYSYIDQHGARILSWDLAKYMNHSCDSNTLSTGYGFEIAIRDIQENEEITDDYGMFNSPEMEVIDCGCINCRGVIHPSDFNNYSDVWDEKVQNVIKKIQKVEQPLWKYVDKDTQYDIIKFLDGQIEYKSVNELRLIRQ